MKIKDYKIDDEIDIDGMIFTVGLPNDHDEVQLFYDKSPDDIDGEMYYVFDEDNYSKDFEEDELFFVFDVDAEEVYNGKFFLVYAKCSLDAKLRVIKTLVETNSSCYSPFAKHAAYPLGIFEEDASYITNECIINGAKEAIKVKSKVDKNSKQAYIVQ